MEISRKNKQYKVSKQVAFNGNKMRIKCWRMQGNNINSAEIYVAQDFVKRFAERESGTLRSMDFTPMRPAANRTEMCNGENICARDKKVFK